MHITISRFQEGNKGVLNIKTTMKRIEMHKMSNIVRMTGIIEMLKTISVRILEIKDQSSAQRVQPTRPPWDEDESDFLFPVASTLLSDTTSE